MPRLSNRDAKLQQQLVRSELPAYSGYGTADWLRALVQSNRAARALRVDSNGLVDWLYQWWQTAQGWVAAFIVGVTTAVVAFLVDVSVETVSDWKTGRCSGGFFTNKRACCLLDGGECSYWKPWARNFGSGYFIYVSSALVFGIIASGLSMTTKRDLVVSQPSGESDSEGSSSLGMKSESPLVAKTMYLATGSGIPEIKSILSGFDIPHLLGFKVLVVKSIGAIFAVATAMCLGKEGPFVHISTCIGYLAATCLPQYADNAMKMREMLSVACSAGLSVAFGAPIGGVLFSYEETSTYFPRRVLWRAFLCSLVAAVVLKELNPTGTGKLVLFETNYGVDYDAKHYIVFILLGVCGGIFGGVFCYANYLWSKTFRQIPIIKKHPVFEVCLVVLVTALLQFPNPLIRETGDKVMEQLLVDCNNVEEDWICGEEAKTHGKEMYYTWLVSGTFIKLLLTIVTFGCKVPSGVIIPALDAGALFGRMIGQLISGISPGIFAMVGSAAFLAGVSRMTVSLTVIMFELTGEVNFIPPFMVAILTAKWVADSISADGVYDLAQHLAGHPFLDAEIALEKVSTHSDPKGAQVVRNLLPRQGDGSPLILQVTNERHANTAYLGRQLAEANRRKILEAGFAMVNGSGICCGYVSAEGLATALGATDKAAVAELGSMINLASDEYAAFVDPNPLCISESMPIEYAIEMFSKLGLSYVAVVADESARFVGLVTKKGLLRYLDSLD